MTKTKDRKAQKSATNKGSAGKRTATPKAGRTGAKPSPAAKRSPASTPQRSQHSGSKNVAKVQSQTVARKTGANSQSSKATPKSATTYTVKEGRKSKTFATKGEAETCARQTKNRNVTITKGTKQPTHRIVNFTAKK